MRVAAHTYAFRDRSLSEALDVIAGAGFENVELWIGHTDGNVDPVRRALTERGLAAVAVGAGGFYEADPAPVRRVFELAAAIGAPAVVACLNPAHAAAVVAGIPETGVLYVENHWYQPLARPAEIRRLLDGFPRLRACLDTGHAALAGHAPHRYAAALGPRLQHVHLKEARYPRLLERAIGRRARRRLLPHPPPVFPGAGVLDVPRLLDALRRIGFDGTIAVEHEGDEPEAALRELRKELLRAGAM